MNEQQAIRMFRVENSERERIPRQSEDARRRFIGQWFSPDANKALHYLRASSRGGVSGTELLITSLPENAISEYLAHTVLAAQGLDLDIEPFEDYLLPRDGTLTFETVALEGVLGDLYGKVDFASLQIAKQKVLKHIGWTEEEQARVDLIKQQNREFLHQR
jgi:hypothetical protein